MRYKSGELGMRDAVMLQNEYGFMGFVVSNDFFYMVKKCGVCRVDIFKDGRVFSTCDPGKYNASERELKKSKKELAKFTSKLLSDNLIEEGEVENAT
jgi:hypothetical protein